MEAWEIDITDTDTTVSITDDELSTVSTEDFLTISAIDDSYTVAYTSDSLDVLVGVEDLVPSPSLYDAYMVMAGRNILYMLIEKTE